MGAITDKNAPSRANTISFGYCKSPVTWLMQADGSLFWYMCLKSQIWCIVFIVSLSLALYISMHKPCVKCRVWYTCGCINHMLPTVIRVLHHICAFHINYQQLHSMSHSNREHLLCFLIMVRTYHMHYIVHIIVYHISGKIYNIPFILKPIHHAYMYV